MNENSIFKTFIKYISLNIFGMIGISFYILADTFFIARGLGPDGLTALNLAIPVYSLIHGLGLMIGMGASTKYSILMGSGNSEQAKKYFSDSVIFALSISVIFILTGIFFPGAISRLVGSDIAVYDMTRTYLRVILIFSPMFMLNNIVICFVRNDGNPNLAMAGMLIGSLANIIFDYILVFPCRLGILGAVLATGFSPVISLIVLSFHFTMKKNSFIPSMTTPKFNRIKTIFSLGFSSLITELSSGVVILAFNYIILGLEGNIGIAAYSVIANLSLVFVSIFNGISQGIQPIISYSFGRRNHKNVETVYRYAIISSFIVAIIIYAFTLIFKYPIISAFNNEGDQNLARIAAKGITIYFSAFFFVGVNVITSIFFSSVNEPKKSFTISILRGVVVIIPAAFILSKLFGMTGIWLAFPITELLTMLVSIMFRLKQRKVTIS